VAVIEPSNAGLVARSHLQSVPWKKI